MASWMEKIARRERKSFRGDFSIAAGWLSMTLAVKNFGSTSYLNLHSETWQPAGWLEKRRLNFPLLRPLSVQERTKRMAENEVEQEALCLGLVREYLFRHGYMDVLRLFDEETQARERAVSATPDLVKRLHMTKLYKQNASSTAPTSSINVAGVYGSWTLR